jgi:hypothetical protein
MIAQRRPDPTVVSQIPAAGRVPAAGPVPPAWQGRDSRRDQQPGAVRGTVYVAKRRRLKYKLTVVLAVLGIPVGVALALVLAAVYFGGWAVLRMLLL